MKSPRKMGNKSEKKTSKSLKAKSRPNSGATWHSKGDLITEEGFMGYQGELIENKVTSKKSYSIKHKELSQHEKYAILEDKLPLFVIEFSTENKSYAVIPLSIYKELTNDKKEGGEEK